VESCAIVALFAGGAHVVTIGTQKYLIFPPPFRHGASPRSDDVAWFVKK
jgi:hypothetical protein